MIKVGFIGYGFVGQAVEDSLNKSKVSTIIYDLESHPTTFESIITTDFVFICIPTERSADDLDTATITDCDVRSILTKLHEREYRGIVIIKSTLPIDFASTIESYKLRIAINPEFLTQRNAQQDFINSNQIIIGINDSTLIDPITKLYGCTFVRKRWIFPMSIVDAIAYKLFTNAFLASKVALFNEFHSIFTSISDTKWEDFIGTMKQDPRIGTTHMDVPGWDEKYGFGGKCFPACINHLNNFSSLHDENSSIINEVIKSNKSTRY